MEEKSETGVAADVEAYGPGLPKSAVQELKRGHIGRGGNRRCRSGADNGIYCPCPCSDHQVSVLLERA